MGDILVHVIPRQTGDGYLAPPLPIGPEAFSKRAGDIADGVATVANSVRADLEKKLASEPQSAFTLDQIELKFSLELEAEAGVVLARAKASTGFEVSVTWKCNP